MLQTGTDNNDSLPAEVTRDFPSRPSSHVFINTRLHLSDSISCSFILDHQPYCIARCDLRPRGNQVPVWGGLRLTLIVCLLAVCCHSDWSFLFKLGFIRYFDPKGQAQFFLISWEKLLPPKLLCKKQLHKHRWCFFPINQV